MSSKNGNWRVERVSSTTGPLDGTALSSAIRSPQSVAGQTEVLWSAAEGWKAKTSYRFHITHRPNDVTRVSYESVSHPQLGSDQSMIGSVGDMEPVRSFFLPAFSSTPQHLCLSRHRLRTPDGAREGSP